MIPLPQVDDESGGWVKLEGAVAHQTLINGASIMLRRQGDEVIIPRSEIAGTLIDCYVTVYVHADSGDLKLKFHDPRSKWARAIREGGSGGETGAQAFIDQMNAQIK